MPNERLKTSQMMTIGAKALPIFAVPNGWIRNRRTRMAQVVPTIVAEVMSGFTTFSLQDESSAAE